MKTSHFLVIEFLDGSKETYSFPPQNESLAARQIRLDEFFKGNFVSVVTTEEELMIYPISAIRSLRFSGVPNDADAMRLPPSTIRQAERR